MWSLVSQSRLFFIHLTGSCRKTTDVKKRDRRTKIVCLGSQLSKY